MVIYTIYMSLTIMIIIRHGRDPMGRLYIVILHTHIYIYIYIYDSQSSRISVYNTHIDIIQNEQHFCIGQRG